MSDELTDYDRERESYAETCSNCGNRVTYGGEFTPIRCVLCGHPLHGEEEAWHRPRARYGCDECGRGFGPRGETMHWPGCSKADADLEIAMRAHPSAAPRSALPVPDEADPRCPAHPTEPLFECVECADRRLKVRLP